MHSTQSKSASLFSAIVTTILSFNGKLWSEANIPWMLNENLPFICDWTGDYFVMKITNIYSGIDTLLLEEIFIKTPFGSLIK